jgi:uncharacterized membrane protein YhiD involved in acid resistance
VTDAVDELAQLKLFAQSIAIGALIGLERERHLDNRVGLRTFWACRSSPRSSRNSALRATD